MNTTCTDYLEKRLSTLKRQTTGWVNSYWANKDPRHQEIIAGLAVEISHIEWVLDLVEASDGVNPTIIKRLVEVYHQGP